MRTTERLVPLRDSAPLPLAQGVARILNAKNPIEMHAKALDLVELAVAMAGIIRIAHVLEHLPDLRAEIAPEIEPELGTLASGRSGYSLGKLTSLLRISATALDRLESTKHLGLQALLRPRTSLLGVDEYVEELGSNSSVSRKALVGPRKRGLLGFFELCTAYRNREKGHGATRYDAYYERMAPALCGALADVISSKTLLGDGELMSVERFGSGLRLRRLKGCVGLATKQFGSKMYEGAVIWLRDDMSLPLAPFLTHWLTGDHGDRVGVLSRLEARCKRARYIDYPSGDQITTSVGAVQCLALHRRLQGKPEAEPSPDGVDLDELEDEASADEDRRVFSEPNSEVAFDLGDYEIVEELGRGGMGLVYLAKDLRLNREVAIKINAAPRSLDELDARRIRRETVALARADHPNVIKVFASGRVGGEYFFAMEYINGFDLGRLSEHLRELRASQPRRSLDWSGILDDLGPPQTNPSREEPTDELPVDEAGPSRSFYHELAALFAGAARGVAHLHAQGVVHRDIKPSNLMMTASGERIVVADLGLAKLTDASVALTKTGAGPLGTLRYCAPEQLQPNLFEVDERTDVYSLGATIFEIATGQACYAEVDDRHLIRQIILGGPLSPRKVDPDMPRELAIVIETALAREPDRRYQSAEELADDLERVASLRPPKARRVGPLRRAFLWSRRNPRAAVTVAAIPALITLGGWIAIKPPGWLLRVFGQIETPVVERYAAVDFRWGVLEGLGELTPAEAASAHRYYLLQKLDGRVTRVEAKHGAGGAFPQDAGVVSWDFEYTDEGTINEIVSRNLSGKVVEVRSYKCRNKHNCVIRILDENGKSIGSQIIDEWEAEPTVEHSDIFVVKHSYDDEGRRTQELYLGYGASEPRCHPDGYWGIRFEFDGLELLPERRVYLGASGEDGPTMKGIAHETLEYDEYGNITRRAYFDEKDQPILGSKGCEVWEYAFSGPDTLTGATCRDRNGDLQLSDDGWARLEAESDKFGNMISTTYFGVNDEPVINLETHAHRLVMEYDERGYKTAQFTYASDGAPTRRKDRAHHTKYDYDRAGNLRSVALFDGKGEPDTVASGVHEWRYDRDERGNITRYAYFAPSGEAMHRQGGYAAQSVTYDEDGRYVSDFAYLDVDGQPTTNASGYHAYHQEHDPRGSVVRWSYTDVAGGDTVNDEGIHRVEIERDSQGRAASHAYFGLEDRPIRRDGYHRVTSEYDGRGQLTTREYFDVDGERTTKTHEAARETRSYDEHGRLSEQRFFDANHGAVVISSGYHMVRHEYDENGHVRQRTYHDVHDEPTWTSAGYHRIEYIRDRLGREEAVTYFGTAGEKVTSDRCWRIRYEHDSYGRVSEVSCDGVDADPTMFEHGYHMVAKGYDDHGRTNLWTFYDTEGERSARPGGASRIDVGHDLRGAPTEYRYFGREDDPIDVEGEFHRLTLDVDERGDVRSKRVTAVDGEPAKDVNGCYALEYQRDPRGDEVAVNCLDASGGRMLSKEGWSRIQKTRDVYGRVTEYSYQDAQGEPAEVEGFHRHENVYDSLGQRTMKTSYNARDQIGERVTWEYDRYGNVSREAHFGENGAPALDDGRCHVRTFEYDDQGHLLRRACFDTNSRPRRDKFGVGEYRHDYDSRGRVVRTSYWNHLGDPTYIRTRTCHAVEFSYDDQERSESERCFDIGGRPRLDAGYHETRRRRDAQRRVIEESRWGRHGEPAASTGVHLVMTEWDDHADTRTQRYFNREGKPATRSAIVETEFDEHGRELLMSFFTGVGEPTLASRDGQHCHQVAYEYEADGSEKVTVCRGIDGEGVVQP